MPLEAELLEQVIGRFRGARIGRGLGGVRDHKHLVAAGRGAGEGDEAGHVTGVDAARARRIVGRRLFKARVDGVSRHDLVDLGSRVRILENLPHGPISGTEAGE